MRRADRLFQIIQYLKSRRLTTAYWLSEKLEVSERTIYRDIKDLMLSGVPIDGEAGVGYVLRSGFDIPPIMFTKEEVEALVTAAKMVKTFAGTNLAKSAEMALDKIEAVLPDKLKQEVLKPRLFTPQGLISTTTSNLLDKLREATNLQQVIEIEYESLENNISQRMVKPLGLLFWGKHWTLATWCELRQGYRSFRVDKVTSITLTDKTFSEQGDLSFSHFLSVNYQGVDASNFTQST